MKPSNPYARWAKYWLVLLGLLLPSVCFASDMTGALPYFFGAVFLFCVVVGLALAAILRFGFKTGNKVWWIVPGLPVLAFVGFVSLFPNVQDTTIHAGPDIEFSGSRTVTVSKKFGRPELERALAKIQSAQFKSDLARYTSESVSDYVFAIDLTIQANRDARRYVSISTRPEVQVNTPTCEGIMFLFSKAVIEFDPVPSDEVYTEPSQVVQSTLPR